MKKRILLVDDHELVRKGVRAVLDGQYEVCGEAANGQEAIAQSIRLNPDLIILDASMPVMNGFEAARRIRDSQPAVKILILSMHEKLEREAKSVGADAALTKTCSPHELTKAIDRLLNGRN